MYMYVCVHIYIYICIYTYIHIYSCSEGASTSLNEGRAYLRAFSREKDTNLYIYIYTHTRISLSLYIYTYMYIHIYIYIYMYIYIYTYYRFNYDCLVGNILVEKLAVTTWQMQECNPADGNEHDVVTVEHERYKNVHLPTFTAGYLVKQLHTIHPNINVTADDIYLALAVEHIRHGSVQHESGHEHEWCLCRVRPWFRACHARSQCRNFDPRPYVVILLGRLPSKGAMPSDRADTMSCPIVSHALPFHGVSCYIIVPWCMTCHMTWYMTRRDATWRDVAWCGVVWRGVAWRGVAWHKIA